MNLHRSLSTRVRIAVTAAAAATIFAGVVLPPAGAASSRLLAVPYRAYPSTSYWNKPLPLDAPIDPKSDQMIAYLRNDSTTNFIQLSGASPGGSWGNPIYWSDSGDPTYAMRSNCTAKMPPEFGSIRIPVGAKPDPTTDAAMTVYDRSKGLAYATFHTEFNASNHTWTACGGTVSYLTSNGLDGDVAASDESRNHGHRGVPPPTYAVRWDEVASGRITHMLKISVNTSRCEHVFPMIGDECGTNDTYAPPEGTRIRIKPSIDLTKLGLNPAALVIARALQRYGAIIGDQSGGTMAMKVENTTAEGRGQLWTGVLAGDSLKAIPISAFQVIRPGYQP